MFTFEFAFTTYANYVKGGDSAPPNLYLVQAEGVEEAFDIVVNRHIKEEDEVLAYALWRGKRKTYNFTEKVELMWIQYVLDRDADLLI